MKLIISTKDKEYVVRIANYIEPDVQNIIKQVNVEYPNIDIITYALYGDSFMSPEERNQIDYYGEIRQSPEEIPYEKVCFKI